MKKTKNISQYRYFRGEDVCPFVNRDLWKWWHIEKEHFDDMNHNETIEEYLRGWFHKKADDSGLTAPGDVEKYVKLHWDLYLRGE